MAFDEYNPKRVARKKQIAAIREERKYEAIKKIVAANNAVKTVVKERKIGGVATTPFDPSYLKPKPFDPRILTTPADEVTVVEQPITPFIEESPETIKSFIDDINDYQAIKKQREELFGPDIKFDMIWEKYRGDPKKQKAIKLKEALCSRKDFSASWLPEWVLKEKEAREKDPKLDYVVSAITITLLSPTGKDYCFKYYRPEYGELTNFDLAKTIKALEDRNQIVVKKNNSLKKLINKIYRSLPLWGGTGRLYHGREEEFYNEMRQLFKERQNNKKKEIRIIK